MKLFNTLDDILLFYKEQKDNLEKYTTFRMSIENLIKDKWYLACNIDDEIWALKLQDTINANFLIDWIWLSRSSSIVRTQEAFPGSSYRIFEIPELLVKNNNRKDYCYACNSDDLYCHMMTMKCRLCNKIILGG